MPPPRGQGIIINIIERKSINPGFKNDKATVQKRSSGVARVQETFQVIN